MQDSSNSVAKPGSMGEPKPQLFRADTDQNGDWYVWRKLSSNGWATMRRCDTREAAYELADHLNTDPDGAVFTG